MSEKVVLPPYLAQMKADAAACPQKDAADLGVENARLTARVHELERALAQCLTAVPESEWVVRRYVSDLLANGRK